MYSHAHGLRSRNRGRNRDVPAVSRRGGGSRRGLWRLAVGRTRRRAGSGETITAGWESEEVKHALDLCLACKACKSECPVSVDMASYKAEFLAHHYQRRSRPVRAMLFGHIDSWAALASHAPRLINALASTGPIARMMQSAAGIAPQRTLPRFAHETFQHWMQRHPPRSEGRRVVLWSDTFTNYFYPQTGRAAVHVLE